MGAIIIKIIEKPTRIESAGNKPKFIDEFVGLANSKTKHVSIAKMKSPAGWIEPAQTPGFVEYTIVLKDTLLVETQTGTITINAGQAVIVDSGEWIRYSTPSDEGAEYIAVCLPAFSPDNVNRHGG